MSIHKPGEILRSEYLMGHQIKMTTCANVRGRTIKNRRIETKNRSEPEYWFRTLLRYRRLLAQQKGQIIKGHCKLMDLTMDIIVTIVSFVSFVLYLYIGTVVTL